MTILIRSLLALALLEQGTPENAAIHSSSPAYELTLPGGYWPVAPRETPIRYSRSRGRESWARVNAIIADSKEALPQNLDGLRAEDVLSRVPLPPEAKWTFHPHPWKDFEVGSFEYRAVVRDLPVLGLAAVLPLQGGSLTILVYAPEPLEKECREDFSEILARITKAPTSWHSPEYYRKVRSMNLVGMSGAVLLTLYLIAWAVIFHGYPMTPQLGWDNQAAFAHPTPALQELRVRDVRKFWDES